MIIAQSLLRMGYIVGYYQFGSGVDPFAFRPGEILQVVQAEAFAAATTLLQIPVDNTIPQIGEGAAFMSVGITPLRASSALEVSITVPIVSVDAISQWIGALFRDATANAIAAAAVGIDVANGLATFQCTARVPAVSTAPTTFSFRYGPGTAAGAYILRSAALASIFGGQSAYLIVREIAA